MVGSFGDVVFEISDKKVFSINNEINRAYKSKISEHTAIFGPGMIRHQGRELTELSFGISLVASLIPDTTPSEQLDKIKTMWEFGEYDYLTLGGQTFGAFPFLIIDISEKSSYFYKFGIDIKRVYRQSAKIQSNNRTVKNSKKGARKTYRSGSCKCRN